MRLGLFGIALLAALLHTAAAFPAPPHDIHFKVYRNGEEFGHHKVSFIQAGEQTIADVEIEFAVTFAGFRVFYYLHRSREIWEGGNLVSIESSTNDDGDTSSVDLKRRGDALAIDGADYRGVAPLELFPTSYWFKETLAQNRLIDTTNGRIFPVVIGRVGRETIEVGGRAVEATRYTLTEQLQMNLWYDDQGNWVKTSFDARGSTIEYVLEPSEQRQARLP